MSMPEIKYAIFDMDGTLLDSMAWWRGIFYEWLMAGDDPCFEPVRLRASEYDYLSLRELTRRLPLEFGITLDRESYLAESDALMLEHYRKDVSPHAPVIERLKHLTSRGVRAGVLSATRHPCLEKALRHFDLLHYFDFVLSPEDFGGIGKENPEAFRRALARFGCLDPRECMVFEDALYSIKVAKSVGCRVTAVLDPSNLSEREEILALADEIIALDYDEALKST